VGSSRREFLASLGTGLAATAFCDRLATYALSQPPGGQIRIRKDVASDEAENDIDSYRKAVEAMKKLTQNQPSNPLGWLRQARIHGTSGSFNKCRHGTWFFAPWHRAYVFYFEEIIRELSDNEEFALPYWNWSETHSIPAAFWGNNNALNESSRGVTQGSKISQDDLDEFVGPSVVSNIVDLPDFESFGGDFGSGQSASGELEVTPHNFVHRWVEGVMASGESPLDPIFWLHHCNVDRLYSEWLRGDGHASPSAATWRNQAFNDFSNRQGQAAGSAFNCENMLNTDNLHYRYDVHSQESDAPESAPARMRWVPITDFTGNQAAVDDGTLTYALKAPEADASLESLDTAIRATDKQLIRLRLEGVTPPRDQDVSVRVFVNCENPSPQTPISDPSYVGSFTFFDAPHANGEHDDHHGHSRNVILNATSAFRKLYGDEAIPGDDVKVNVIPVKLFEKGAAPAALQEIKPESIRLVVARAESAG
jgi:tyrosinase